MLPEIKSSDGDYSVRKATFPILPISLSKIQDGSVEYKFTKEGRGECGKILSALTASPVLSMNTVQLWDEKTVVTFEERAKQQVTSSVVPGSSQRQRSGTNPTDVVDGGGEMHYQKAEEYTEPINKFSTTSTSTISS